MATSQYPPRLSNITNVAPCGSANQITAFTAVKLNYKSIKKKCVHQTGLNIMLLSVCYIKCIVTIQVFVEPQNLIDNLFLQHT